MDENEPEEVDEVIPDPVYVHPRGEKEEEEKEGDDSLEAEAPAEVYEKADITSNVDDKIRDKLDEAEKQVQEVSWLLFLKFTIRLITNGMSLIIF